MHACMHAGGAAKLHARLDDARFGGLEVLQVQRRGARGVAKKQLAARLKRDRRLVASVRSRPRS